MSPLHTKKQRFTVSTHLFSARNVNHHFDGGKCLTTIVAGAQYCFTGLQIPRRIEVTITKWNQLVFRSKTQ